MYSYALSTLALKTRPPTIQPYAETLIQVAHHTIHIDYLANNQRRYDNRVSSTHVLHYIEL